MRARFNRLFVITYGRSGSTLLQGLLNAIPGYRVYGENGGFLTKLLGAHEALTDAHAHLANPAVDRHRNPWFGSSRYDPATLNTAFRNFVDNILFRPRAHPEVRVFGFKEIRYLDLGGERLSNLLSFVRNLYPHAAIIFNTRTITDVLKSGWWRNNFWHGLPKQLTEFEEFSNSYAQSNGDHAIHVRYDQLVDPDRHEVGRLLAFLGETLSPDQIDAVFVGRHSYQNRALTEYLSGRSQSVQLFEADWWRANMDEFRIDVDWRPSVCVATGICLPSVDSSVRISLRAGSRVVQVAGSIATPRVAALYASNPKSADSGFEIECPRVDELFLHGASEGFDDRLVGVIRARSPAEGIRGRGA